MLAERLLSSVMRRANNAFLTLEPSGLDSLPAPVAGRPYLLYVHIPFCERLCPYCSFNRFPYDAERATRYFHNLREEMRMVADLGYDFQSMYVGGGTPTVDIDELVETIDLAKSLFSIREVSSETNPNHLHPKWIEPLLERVDRLSVGVQSLDDELLQPDGPLRQVRLGVRDPRAPAVDRGCLQLAQRRHDLQLPEPDSREARGRHRAREAHRRQPDDVLPADGVARGSRVAQAHRRPGRLRPRVPLLPPDFRRDSATRSSRRARGRSPARVAA